MVLSAPLYILFVYLLYGNAHAQNYTVDLWSKNSTVDPLDSYVAYCNIPGPSALDVITNLTVRWYHNSRQITSLCTLEALWMAEKYSCDVLSPQPNNITLRLTVKGVQEDDVGCLVCTMTQHVRENGVWVRGEIVEKKSVEINMRECVNGTFGRNCTNKCSGHCFRGLPCRSSDGVCPKGCMEGWTNSYCNETCPPGYYGRDCEERCGRCRDGAPCHIIDGSCPGDCQPGFIGATCDYMEKLPWDENHEVSPCSLVGLTCVLGTSAFTTITILALLCYCSEKSFGGQPIDLLCFRRVIDSLFRENVPSSAAPSPGFTENRRTVDHRGHGEKIR